MATVPSELLGWDTDGKVPFGILGTPVLYFSLYKVYTTHSLDEIMSSLFFKVDN